jgi:hypothetical protein
MDLVWIFNTDGTLSWRKGRKQVKAGDTAGCLNSDGYCVVSYNGSQYKIHRLVYAYHTGEWPPLVDHEDGDKSNNRFSNLRVLSYSDNCINTNKSHGKSSYRGVSLLNGRPRAFIQVRGRREFLGYFKTEKEAHNAYIKRREELTNGLKIGG